MKLIRKKAIGFVILNFVMIVNAGKVDLIPNGQSIGSILIITATHYGAGHLKAAEWLQNILKELEVLSDIAVIEGLGMSSEPIQLYLDYAASVNHAQETKERVPEIVRDVGLANLVFDEVIRLHIDDILQLIEQNKYKTIFFTHIAATFFIEAIKAKLGSSSPGFVIIGTDFLPGVWWKKIDSSTTKIVISDPKTISFLQNKTMISEIFAINPDDIQRFLPTDFTQPEFEDVFVLNPYIFMDFKKPMSKQEVADHMNEEYGAKLDPGKEWAMITYGGTGSEYTLQAMEAWYQALKVQERFDEIQVIVLPGLTAKRQNEAEAANIEKYEDSFVVLKFIPSHQFNGLFDNATYCVMKFGGLTTAKAQQRKGLPFMFYVENGLMTNEELNKPEHAIPLREMSAEELIRGLKECRYMVVERISPENVIENMKKTLNILNI